MPFLNYNPIPSVEPVTSPGNNFQNIRATPQAFGSDVGAGVQALAGQLERSGDELANVAIARQNLINQVTADDYSNKALDAANKILYGDPDKPGDVGFYGLKGENAMREFPNARKNLDRVLQEHRASLQNPVQQHLFDRDIRRTRLILNAEMGRHYDRENNRYTESVYKGQMKLAETDMSQAAAIGDDDKFQAAVERQIAAAVKGGAFTGKSKEEVDAEIARITQNAVETKAERLMAENPLAAQKFLENNRDKLPAEKVLALEGRVKAAAIKQEADDIAAGRPSKVSSGLIRGGAVEKRIEQTAAEVGVSPTMAKVVASIESNFGQTPDRPGSQYRGVYQLGDAAAERVGGRDVEHGVKYLALTKSDLTNKLGREPKDWEVYLAHQQGAEGAATLLANPNVPAGQLLRPSHISQNGGDPNAPASAFVAKWRNEYERRAARISDAPETSSNLEVWGDSLGVGLRTALKAPGQATGGLPPADILARIKSQPEESWRGKTVVLSSGSNQNQMPVVEETIAYLKEKGANVVAVGYGPKFPEKNAQLVEIAERQGVKVVPAEGVAASEGVHPGPQGYAKMAQNITQLAQGKKADTVVGLPPLDPGELPDVEVPGLAGQVQKILKDPRAVKDGALTPAGELAIKRARTEANTAFAAGQHQVRLRKQAEDAKDEEISQGLLRRMKPDSPNYPTLGEILESDLSPSKKMTMVGFFERQTRPDPASQTSARNQVRLFERMQPDYAGEDKVESEKQINDEYIKGNLTDPAREKLIKDFREIQTKDAPEWEKRKNELFKRVAPKIVPTIAAFGSLEKAVAMDPDAAERVTRWQDAVRDKIQEYKDAKKNPAILFQPGTREKPNPEFVGGDEFLRPYVGDLGDKIKRGTADKTTATQVKDISQMTTLRELQAAAKANPMLRDAAMARALELGLIRPPTAQPNPSLTPPDAR